MTTGQKMCLGARFSDNRKYRYSLFRIWDKLKPKGSFTGRKSVTSEIIMDFLSKDKTNELLNILKRLYNLSNIPLIHCLKVGMRRFELTKECYNYKILTKF